MEPIKSGDECIVISGTLGDRSPNKGRRVLALHSTGQDLVLHTPQGFESFGKVWRVRSKDGKPFVRAETGAHQDVPADQADYPASWLQKADAPPPESLNTGRAIEEKVQ